jgi:hypothetical protein
MIRTATFIGWFFITLLFKIPAYISFVFGLFILIISSAGMLTNHQGFALRLTTYAFGFLFVGFISYIRQLKQNEK